MTLIRDASQRGWRYTLAIIFNRAVPVWLFRCRRFVIYRLESLSSIEPDSQIDLRWCKTEDEFIVAEQLTYFHRKDSKTGPARAVQAVVENEVQSAFWMAGDFVEESELGIRILLEPKQAWLFAAMVNKKMRGRGIYSKVLRFMISESNANGFDDLLVSVNPDNKPSNFVHRKYAKDCVGKVVAIRCLNWAWCFSTKRVAQNSRFTTNAKLRPIEFSIPRETKA